MKTHRNFIASRRKGSGFSSKEFSKLIGLPKSSFSELELGSTRPRFHTALALEVLFGTSLGALYPDDFDAHEERIMAAAKMAEERIRDQTDDRSALKRRFLEAIAQRARMRSDA